MSPQLDPPQLAPQQAGDLTEQGRQVLGVQELLRMMAWEVDHSTHGQVLVGRQAVGNTAVVVGSSKALVEAQGRAVRNEVEVLGRVVRSEVEVLGRVVRNEVEVLGRVVRSEVEVLGRVVRNEVEVLGRVVRSEVEVLGEAQGVAEHSMVQGGAGTEALDEAVRNVVEVQGGAQGMAERTEAGMLVLDAAARSGVGKLAEAQGTVEQGMVELHSRVERSTSVP